VFNDSGDALPISGAMHTTNLQSISQAEGRCVGRKMANYFLGAKNYPRRYNFGEARMSRLAL
jgi:hypothetical protein